PGRTPGGSNRSPATADGRPAAPRPPVGLTFPGGRRRMGGFHHQETPWWDGAANAAGRAEMMAARGARRFLTGFFVITALVLAAASPSLAATPSADLSISKTTGSGSVSPGASIPYSITVHNHGPDAAASAK